MSTDPHPLDPANVIREAYRIEGIDAGSCRTIFLDWALGLPDGADQKAAVQTLLAHHADEAAHHPMTVTLTQALAAAPRARRRGGAMGRRPDAETP